MWNEMLPKQHVCGISRGRQTSSEFLQILAKAIQK